jgi:hypothetical protein
MSSTPSVENSISSSGGNSPWAYHSGVQASSWLEVTRDDPDVELDLAPSISALADADMNMVMSNSGSADPCGIF